MAMNLLESIEALGASGTADVYTAPGVLTVRRGLIVDGAVLPVLRRQWLPLAGETEDQMTERRNELLGLLALWQKGDSILADIQIKPLCPPPVCDGVWELRETKQRPQMRVIGHIPTRNLFVVTGIYPRPYLGHRGSPQWNVAISNALAHSRKWFAGQPTVKWTTSKFRQTDIAVVCDDF